MLGGIASERLVGAGRSNVQWVLGIANECPVGAGRHCKRVSGGCWAASQASVRWVLGGIASECPVGMASVSSSSSSHGCSIILINVNTFCHALSCTHTHTHRFLCSKSKRIYLHRDIRMLFARRAPDTEPGESHVTLHIVMDGPEEPRYSPSAPV